MKPFPHHYHASAQGRPAGQIEVTDGQLRLATNAPPEFGGPDGLWSPETLLVAAVADCYVLSFWAVARAARLDWETLGVEVDGVLDRADGLARFVRFDIEAKLVLAAERDTQRASALMEKAKQTCLITNSLRYECPLRHEVTTGATATASGEPPLSQRRD